VRRSAAEDIAELQAAFAAREVQWRSRMSNRERELRRLLRAMVDREEYWRSKLEAQKAALSESADIRVQLVTEQSAGDSARMAQALAKLSELQSELDSARAQLEEDKGLQSLKDAITLRAMSMPATADQLPESPRNNTQAPPDSAVNWQRSLKDAITAQCAARMEVLMDSTDSDGPPTPHHAEGEVSEAIMHSVDCFIDLIALVRIQHERPQNKSSSGFKQIAQRAHEKYRNLSKEAAAALSIFI